MSKFVIRTVASGIKSDLKHTNGQVIATSEGYKAKASCLNGIESVQKNAPEAEIVEEEKKQALRSPLGFFGGSTCFIPRKSSKRMYRRPMAAANFSCAGLRPHHRTFRAAHLPLSRTPDQI